MNIITLDVSRQRLGSYLVFADFGLFSLEFGEEFADQFGGGWSLSALLF